MRSVPTKLDAADQRDEDGHSVTPSHPASHSPGETPKRAEVGQAGAKPLDGLPADVPPSRPVGTSPQQVDELLLVRRVVEGDRRAFEWIIRRYDQRLYRLARATLRDHAEAKDAVQDTYVAAYQSLGRFRGQSTLSTWLARILLNECIARQRRDRRRQNVLPMVSMDSRLKAINGVADAGEQPDGSLARSQMHEVLEHEIGKLPESLRVVFVLRAVEEMSVKDTAQSLGISEATVRIRHFRARRLLRARIAGLVGSAKHDLFEFGDKDCDDMVANVLARLDVDRA